MSACGTPVDRGIEHDPRGIGLRAEGRDRVGQQLRDVRRLAMERERAGLGERQRAEVIDEER